ncbi:MAG: hypothetical protein COV67_03495 [Nitrospinae bacterium CG11_big_fil_rev_8_21_14_0_20_56_8]|nr:MAG: hypothetical protein COV67_03495 [Nitrospinae bacterium CG11_big_fil_rev_8_21_14_0_20_56_8]
MAEDTDTKNTTADEAAELERLLAEAEQTGVKAPAGGLKALMANKKLLVMVGLGALLLIGGIGAGVYFLLKEPPPEVSPEAQKAAAPPAEKKEEVLKKVYVFPLDTFFLPLKENEHEVGRFVSITPNLMLSNPTLYKEVTKVKPLIRKNIYNILRRKSPDEYINRKTDTEERIKKEILTTSNALLLSGTGTIEDVFFTKFLVK